MPIAIGFAGSSYISGMNGLTATLLYGTGLRLLKGLRLGVIPFEEKKRLANILFLRETEDMKSVLLLLHCLIVCIAGGLPLRAAESKPVFLYSRYFNAKGENRYTPEGTFKNVLDRLGES